MTQAILLLGIYPRKMKAGVHSKTYTPNFTVAPLAAPPTPERLEFPTVFQSQILWGLLFLAPAICTGEPGWGPSLLQGQLLRLRYPS